jgi:hypothetical protein
MPQCCLAIHLVKARPSLATANLTVYSIYQFARSGPRTPRCIPRDCCAPYPPVRPGGTSRYTSAYCVFGAQPVDISLNQRYGVSPFGVFGARILHLLSIRAHIVPPSYSVQSDGIYLGERNRSAALSGVVQHDSACACRPRHPWAVHVECKFLRGSAGRPRIPGEMRRRLAGQSSSVRRLATGCAFSSCAGIWWHGRGCCRASLQSQSHEARMPACC